MADEQLNLHASDNSSHQGSTDEPNYSGDKPNPRLAEFVARHLEQNPYDPETDSYQAPNFDTPIVISRADDIYNMHRYWSKKAHGAIRQYIRHYTKKGDLVLDPFCGSGSTALSALMEGRKAIAIDRSPAATFITKNYCSPVNANELKKVCAELVRKAEPEIGWLYETRCDRCGGRAMTNYIVYSQVFQCPRCMEKVALYDCPQVEICRKDGKKKPPLVCPHCLAGGHEEKIKSGSRKFGAIPVVVNYSCLNGCTPEAISRSHNDADLKKREYFHKYDLSRIREIDESDIPYWYPGHRMMNVESDTERWGDKGVKGLRFAFQLHTKRNLWALAVIRSLIEKSTYADALLFPFSATLLGTSKMCCQGNTAILPGTYYIPPVSKEINVLTSYKRKLNSIIKAWSNLNIDQDGHVISTQSAIDLNNIPSSSIDYIFTDPPYAGKFQYGELNFIWEAWLGFDTHWHDDEIIVNKTRRKTLQDWADAMQLAMNECYRVLKPGRCISLCYHDTSEGSWALIQDIMAKAGFMAEKVDAVISIDTKQKSYNQQTADKVNKRDLVINFRKPKPGELSGFVLGDNEDAASFEEKASQIIRAYLDSHPGATKDRVWDDLVSRMVRKGQMEPHDFDALLAQVAEEVREEGEESSGRWYLAETEAERIDAAETEREDRAAEAIAAYIRERLASQFPEAVQDQAALYQANGVHYSDIFEFYIGHVKDKPGRLLADILPDYFYKTPDGCWRVPATEEEIRQKAESRIAGTGRRIRRFVAMLKSGVPVAASPNPATLADWMRHCKNAGMLAEGIILYERAGMDLNSLPEALALDVEESYEVCKSRQAEKSGNYKSGARGKVKKKR